MAGDASTPGVVYWSAELGPQMWHQVDLARVDRDLDAIRGHGFATIRLPLAWDAFMPSDRGVHPRRLSELGRVLDAAAERSLRVVPVLFAQSLGDCVQLPAYTVDPGAPRPGVRVISDGRVRRGGPRDLYTDALMIELAGRWLEQLLSACGGHPAVAAWDLGHDPASTIRPLRFGDLRSWVRLMADQVHAAGDACSITLGAADVLNARGVRLHLVADLVDSLGLSVLPQTLRLAPEPLAVEPVLFVIQLAQRLAGHAISLAIITGVATPAGGPPPEGEPGPPAAAAPGVPRRPSPRDLPLVDPEAAGAHSRELLARLPQAGAAAALAWTWAGAGRRALRMPPFDRFPSLGRCGLTGPDGALTPAGEAWAQAAGSGERGASPAPWPARLDEEDYYSHLPESALELFSTWGDVHRD